MIRSYFISAVRNLLRHKNISLINLFGLSLGLSAFTLILLFIIHELSYDQNFRHNKRISRILTRVDGQKEEQRMLLSSTAAYIKPFIEDSVEGVEAVCRMFNPEENFIRKWIPADNHPYFMYADPSFFEVFEPDILDGNPSLALRDTQSVVLTRKLAEQISPGESMVGESLVIHGRSFRVDAVIENLPGNTHLDFDILISFSSLTTKGELRQSLDYSTYILLKRGYNTDTYRERLVHCCDSILNSRFADSGVSLHTLVQPLRKIHLYSSEIRNSYEINGSLSEILFYLFIAVFIVVVAIFNFINLHTANTLIRTREIGIRKVAGADSRSLQKQFRAEVALTVGVALFISFGLTEALRPSFSQIMNRTLDIPVAGYLVLALILLAIIFLVIMPGVMYPLRNLKKIPPVLALSYGGINTGHKKLSTIAVIIQYIISFILVSSYIALQRQHNHMRKTDPGYAAENLMVYYKANNRFGAPFSPLREKLLLEEGVSEACASDGIPGIVPVLTNYWKADDTPENALLITENRVRDNYIDTYGIEIVEGRNFDGELDGDNGKFILNEAASQLLGIAENPIGQVIRVFQVTDTVIGIARNFCFRSPEESIGPLVITRYYNPYRFITVKMEPGSDTSSFNRVSRVISDYYPGDSFGSFRMQELSDKVLEMESKKLSLVLWGTILSLLISMLGLYAHTTFFLARKNKEIGIRKAFGSISRGIFWKLSGVLLKWIIYSILLAMPFSYFINIHILQSYNQQIAPSLWPSLLSACIVFFAAFVTVSLILFHKSRARAVESLRYE